MRHLARHQFRREEKEQKVNNIELLKRAAQSVGMTGEWSEKLDCFVLLENGRYLVAWNPIKYDSDAFRLAIDAGIDIHIRDGYTDAVVQRAIGKSACCEPHCDDKAAATRLAIARAAAELIFWELPAGRMS